MEKRNKILIVIIAVLVVAIGLTGTFAYQNYRTSEMDKKMVEYQVLATELDEKYAETNQIANSSAPDYDKIYSNIDYMINRSETGRSKMENAYQYADGPYKDVIAYYLKKLDLTITNLGLWKQRVQYIQEGNYFLSSQTIKQEEDIISESNKVSSDISTFLSTHPDIREHMKKQWNWTFPNEDI